ncbi:MAG: hypothetical protein AAB646_00260 [Patescibacteria group bacterium]
MVSVAIFLCLMALWCVAAFLAFYALAMVFVLCAKSDPRRIKAACSMADRMLRDRRLRLPALLFSFGWSAKGIALVTMRFCGASTATVVACGALGMLFLSAALAATAKFEPAKFPRVLPIQETAKPAQKEIILAPSEWEVATARIRAERMLCRSAS